METRIGAHAVTAVFTQGKLLLAARGVKRGPDDQVLFEPTALFDVPPSFVLQQRHGAESDVAGGLTPYEVAMIFAVASPPDEVLIRSVDGTALVPVLVAEDAELLERRLPVALVRMSAFRSGDGSVAIPPHFEEMLAQGGEDVRTPLLWPIRLGPLFLGRLEFEPANPRRAIGYSDDFNLAEAFRDALKSLPSDATGIGGCLTTVHVTDLGALLSGLGGGQRMFVAILAY